MWKCVSSLRFRWLVRPVLFMRCFGDSFLRFPRTGLATTSRRAAVRETCVSYPHWGPFKVPLNPSSIMALWYWGPLERALKWAPMYFFLALLKGQLSHRMSKTWNPCNLIDWTNLILLIIMLIIASWLLIKIHIIASWFLIKILIISSWFLIIFKNYGCLYW